MGEKRSCATAYVEEGEFAASGAFCRHGLTKEDAEDLLDWLEANGYRRFELEDADDGGFVVCWKARTART